MATESPLQHLLWECHCEEIPAAEGWVWLGKRWVWLGEEWAGPQTDEEWMSRDE